MKIDITANSNSTTIPRGIKSPKSSEHAVQHVASDNVKTSKEVQILSRSLPSLKERLKPRDDVLKTFSGSVEEELEINDQSADLILSQL
jgi:hypothetical protein